MKKILIVDDHGIIRTGVKMIIREITSNFEYFQATNKEEAFSLLKANNDFDLVILDVNIPNYSCENMIEFCKIKSPKAKIMVLTMNAESMMARRLYLLGIDAFVNKGSEDNQIKTAIEDLFNNKKYFSPQLLRQLANDVFSPNSKPYNPFEELSQREFEVMIFMFEGKNSREIASLLNVHPSSIGTYKARIFEKMNVTTTFELYDLYIRLNLQMNENKD